MAGVKRKLCTDSDIHALHKELDEVLCPICMDHPHNAVLLLCSSHQKGCRSYICDTSYRHSNCLDRFKKLRDNSESNSTLPNALPINLFGSSNTYDTNLNLRNHIIGANENENLNVNNRATSRRILEGSVENTIQDSARLLEILEAGNSESFSGGTEVIEVDEDNSSELRSSLKCPLCRGAVLRWEVVEEARKYLNSKRRSCSREICSFSGTYQELRRHARRVHPTTRPSDIDPSRERAWRCLERQREYGDIVSAIHSAIPGAVVVGDYVIENGDRLSVEREGRSNEVNPPWWNTFFLFQMIGSVNGETEPRARSRAWPRHRRSRVLHERRFLWGENLLGLQEDDDDLHILSDSGEDASPIPRRRRRLARSRSDDDQS